MAETGAIVLFLCQLSVLFCGIYGFLDMEELKSVNYGIDIENTPVMFKEELPEGAVRLSSKHGQQYQCSYPDKVTKEKQEEKEKIAMETGIPELLKPMEEGPCLHYSSGWWDYEFCYGKHIRQFHMEDGKIRGDVIFLGHYESEYDWNNVTATQANRLNRYHSQRYVNGSLCDLTGKARRTEVRFVCADGQGDYLGRVEEAESCVYVLTVYTTKICRHPYLKPPSVNRPVTITCSPLLDAEQYQEYLHEQKVSESAIADETADRFSKFPPETAQYDDSTALTGDGTDESESSKDNTFVESLMKGIREMLAENAQDGNKVLRSDILKSARDISKSIQQQLRQQKEKSANTEREAESRDDEGDDDEEGEDISDDVLMKRGWQKLRERLEAIKRKRAEAIAKSEVGRKTLEEGRSGEQDRKREGGSEDEKEEEDADVMEEFDKGLQDIAPSARDKARLASHSDSVRITLQSQFNDIIAEAQEEMAQEATDDDPAVAVDKGLAYKKLSHTLGALLSRLETAQKDIKDMDDALENMKGESKQQQQEQTQQQQQQQQETQQQSQQQQQLQQHQQAMAEDDTVDTEDQDVTASTETPPAVDTQKEPTERVKGGSKERLEDAATEHRVNVMRKRKANKGMQVKFVTLGYYNDDGTIQIISGDDKSSVSKVMVAVLGIGNEAAKEAEKHERLADNYNFVWPKKTGQHDQKQEVTTSQSDQD